MNIENKPSIAERFGDAEVLVPEGDYVLRIERVLLQKDGYAIKPLARVVGGDHDGELVCPGLYWLTGPKAAYAYKNIRSWGITAEQIDELAGPSGEINETVVKAIADLLIGREARAWLEIFKTHDGREVNSHPPGNVRPLTAAA